MISLVRGSLWSIEPIGESAAEVTVDVSGVGYEVLVGARLAAGLGGVGANVELSVYTHVREGAITLYGFADREERRTFSMLISAHGVGPALALAILGALSPAGLARAVATADVDALTAVPGIGKKTAQRLVIELGSRLDTFVTPSLVPPGSAAEADAEIRDALTSLGYGIDEVRTVIEALPSEGSLEERLRLALRELAPAR